MKDTAVSSARYTAKADEISRPGVPVGLKTAEFSSQKRKHTGSAKTIMKEAAVMQTQHQPRHKLTFRSTSLVAMCGAGAAALVMVAGDAMVQWLLSTLS